MVPNRRTRDIELRRKRVNNPNIPLSDNVEKFMNSFVNWSIAVERGLGSMLSDILG